MYEYWRIAKKTGCVHLEMDRGITAWFPLCMAKLDRYNREITAPDWMMEEKLSPPPGSMPEPSPSRLTPPRSSQGAPPARRRKTPHPRPRPKGMPW